MAASVYSIWEVQSLGSASNSGIFDPNVTMAANLSSANGTSVFPTVTTATYSFKTEDIGNYLFVRSGTNWTPGWYQITGLAGTSAIVNANKNQYTLSNLQPGFLDGIGLVNSISSATWTVDYTQKTSPRNVYSDIVLLSPTTYSSAGYTVNAAMPGNSVRITGGTGFTAGIYIITAASGTSVTLDRSAGIQGSTGGQGNFGGALSNIYNAAIGMTQICGDKVVCLVKNDDVYTASGDTQVPSYNTSAIFLGYGTYRGDNQKVTINVNASSSALSVSGSGFSKFFNFTYNGNNNLNSYAHKFSGPTVINYNCDILNLTGVISGLAYNCLIKNCTSPAFTSFVHTTVSGCAHTGTQMFPNANAYYSIFKNNSSTGKMFALASYAGNLSILSNVFYNNTCTYLIEASNAAQSCTFVTDNVFSGNACTVYSQLIGYSNYMYDLYSNAYYNNTYINNEPPNVFGSTCIVASGEVYLSANPFTDPTNNNFSYNNHPQGGQLIKNKGVIPTTVINSIPDYNNIGFIQNKAIPYPIGNAGGFRG